MSEQVRRKLKAAMQENARLQAFSDEAQAHITKEERKSRERLDMEQAENARLKAEVERLTKAGDNLARVCRGIYGGLPLWEEWNAAKGVQS